MSRSQQWALISVPLASSRVLKANVSQLVEVPRFLFLFLANQQKTTTKLIDKTSKVPRYLFPDDKAVNTAFDDALKTIESLGCTIVDDVEFSEFNSHFTYSDENDWTMGLRIGTRESPCLVPAQV